MDAYPFRHFGNSRSGDFQCFVAANSSCAPREQALQANCWQPNTIRLYRWFPSILQALTIILPETLMRWHRAGFRSYWRWKSRRVGGRPPIDTELRVLIRRMSLENPLWGAPRIHGELLKLGFEVAQSSVAKYMVKRRAPPSQGWRAFLHNHEPEIAAMDLFVVPTVTFKLLYGFVI